MNHLVPSPSRPSAVDPTPELLIALRKSTKSCTTKHLIASVVFFSHLSTTYSAFAFVLSSMLAPTLYHETLLDLGW